MLHIHSSVRVLATGMRQLWLYHTTGDAAAATLAYVAREYLPSAIVNVGQDHSRVSTFSLSAKLVPKLVPSAALTSLV